MSPPSVSVSVMIPCLNEETTIGAVIADFRQELPEAAVYVFDNASCDETAARAFRAGAQVITVPARGKGNVVRAMFATAKTDVMVMVDGDGTYSGADVRRLLQPVLEGTAEMVVGSRLLNESCSQFRLLNVVGNRIFAALASIVLRRRITDALSGYRAFSRRFVQSVEISSSGFEVEMELATAAARHSLRVQEIPVGLRPRPAESKTKIRIFADGALILRKLVQQASRDLAFVPSARS